MGAHLSVATGKTLIINIFKHMYKVVGLIDIILNVLVLSL